MSELPFAPPLAPMLARLRDELPRGDDWLYEPKWDGFRALVWRDGDEVTITSRDTRPFERYFPELIDPLRAALPSGCVVDGEIVVGGPEGLEFDSLLLRIHPAASRVKLLAEQSPASFVAFDCPAAGGADLRATRFHERRAALESMLEGADSELAALHAATTTIVLTPQTDDPDRASQWFTRFEREGLDGVIAKTRTHHYEPGERVMTKVKLKRTADCVVGGYRLHKDGAGVGSLLLGLYDDSGTLQYVGHTSSFRAAERRALLEELKALEGPSGFGAGRTPGGPSRWRSSADSAWVPVEPRLVCEVEYDRWQGERFRHATRFLRWRTDKPARECRLDQVTAT